jgi:hypothetical protein
MGNDMPRTARQSKPVEQAEPTLPAYADEGAGVKGEKRKGDKGWHE